jgi:hypothetical protein
MSGTLTVIGGTKSDGSLSGIVSLPAAYPAGGGLIASLQSALDGLSGAVTTGGATLINSSVGGAFSTSGPGLVVLSNVDSLGNTVSGAPASYSATLGGDITGLVVEEPSAVTVSGPGTSGFLGVFSSNSSVNFTDGGAGTIAASGNDVLNLSGASWSVFGGSIGNNSINVDSASANITLSGAGLATGNNTTPSNAIGSYSGLLNVVSEGTRDFILTDTQGETTATDSVTVTGSANIIDSGAADTITADGSGSVSAHFGAQGGSIYFVNNTSVASQIVSSIDTVQGTAAYGLITTPGSVTAFGGAGGGIYDGGTNGDNSLVGGAGAVTLFAAGLDNTLVATGGSNILNTASGSNDTLYAGGLTQNNTFFLGNGTESVKSAGHGKQVYFAGLQGSETIVGSTNKAASNEYIFDQSSAQGGGTYTLVNFKPGSGFINLTDSVGGVKITGFESLSGASSGTQIDLSNGSTIKLVGVSASSFSSTIIGGKDF